MKVPAGSFTSAIDLADFFLMFSLLNLALPHRENKRTVSILFVKRVFNYLKLLAWKNWGGVISDRIKVLEVLEGRTIQVGPGSPIYCGDDDAT